MAEMGAGWRRRLDLLILLTSQPLPRMSAAPLAHPRKVSARGAPPRSLLIDGLRREALLDPIKDAHKET